MPFLRRLFAWGWLALACVGHLCWCRCSIPRAWHSLKPFLDEFDHPIWETYGERALRFGHSGADWMGLLGRIESLRHGTTPPVSTVDAVTWSAIGPLSEQSIVDSPKAVEMPDFSKGE